MRLTDEQEYQHGRGFRGWPDAPGLHPVALAYRGRVSMVSAAGQRIMRVDVSAMMGGNRSLSGVFLGAEIATDRVHNNIQRLIDEAARGELQVVIDRTYPLSAAADAHTYIESRQAVGRVLLIP